MAASSGLQGDRHLRTDNPPQQGRLAFNTKRKREREPAAYPWEGHPKVAVPRSRASTWRRGCCGRLQRCPSSPPSLFLCTVSSCIPSPPSLAPLSQQSPGCTHSTLTSSKGASSTSKSRGYTMSTVRKQTNKQPLSSNFFFFFFFFMLGSLIQQPRPCGPHRAQRGASQHG